MDAMDFLMSSADGPVATQPQPHHAPVQGCPYFRGAPSLPHPQQHQQQQNHHPHPHPHHNPHHPHQHQPSGLFHHHPSQIHQYPHYHQQPQVPPLHQPQRQQHQQYPHTQLPPLTGTSTSPPNGDLPLANITNRQPPPNTPHPGTDSHSQSHVSESPSGEFASPWIPGYSQGSQFPWSPVSLGPGSYFGGVGGGSVPTATGSVTAGTPGAVSGPAQPGLVQNLPLPPHSHHNHDSLNLNQFAFGLRHASTHHRFPPTPMPPAAPHFQQQQQQHQQQQQQQQQHQQHQQRRQEREREHQEQHQQHRQHQQQQMSQQHSYAPTGDRSLPPPRPTPPASFNSDGSSSSSSNPAISSGNAAASTMSSSPAESSPVTPPAARPITYPAPSEESRRAFLAQAGASASGREQSTPVQQGGSSGTSEQPARVDSGAAAASDADIQPPMGDLHGVRRVTRARDALTTRAPAHSDDDSEEDMDIMDDDDNTRRYLEQFGGDPFRASSNDELRIRAQQILRGQMPNKRVASKKALSQLESVDTSSLEESERTCVICYNEFGVANPEGVNEAPLRLPSCKHIFGDHCIKKWFEESDSCPYCRDKVHSDPVFPNGSRALYSYIQAGRLAVMRQANEGRGPPAGSNEQFVRILASRDYDSSPPRGFQTGERRSPPSEVSETRRRTRARHGSFRASAANATNNRANPHGGVPTIPLQQSPARDRVNPPDFPPHWAPFQYDSHRSLTPHYVRQYMPMTLPPTHTPMYGYYGSMNNRPPGMFPQPMEPQGMNPPSLLPQVGLGFLGGVENRPYHESGILPAPNSHMGGYPQQLPPVASLDTPNFSGGPTNATAAVPSGRDENWLQ